MNKGHYINLTIIEKQKVLFLNNH